MKVLKFEELIDYGSDESFVMVLKEHTYLRRDFFGTENWPTSIFRNQWQLR